AARDVSMCDEEREQAVASAGERDADLLEAVLLEVVADAEGERVEELLAELCPWVARRSRRGAKEAPARRRPGGGARPGRAPAPGGTTVSTRCPVARKDSASSRQVVFSARRRLVRSRSTTCADQPSTKRGASRRSLPFW